MQDMSPEVIDHAEIMRLIREGAAFRGKTPLPDADTAGTGPFQPVPLVRPQRAAPPPPVPVAPRPEPGFHPAPPPVELDLAALRAEAHALGRAEAEAEAEARIEATRAQAHAAGHAEAMAGAAADLAAARAALLAVTQTLTEASETSAARLFAALDAAVLRLASDRAGMVIDANPAPFRARIEALANRAGAAGAETEIRLNPDDLAAIGPGLCGACLVADPGLARGDALLRTGDMHIDDILSAAPRRARGRPRKGAVA